MIKVKEQITTYILPYNKQLQNSEKENISYFTTYLSNYKKYHFKTEDEFSDWFDNKYSELMEYEHWIDIDENGSTEYVCWDRNEIINCDISISVERGDDE
jgi:hemerythrin